MTIDEGNLTAVGRALLNLILIYQPGKCFEGSIIGSFHVGRKTTGGQLPAAQMVAQALTAISLSAAGFIGAIAIGHIRLLVAIHGEFLFYGMD
jgi:hypothetical protein